MDKDYLVKLYEICMERSAQTILELGVSEGYSTRAFLASIHGNGGYVISIDKNDCHLAVHHNRWFFIHADDRDIELFDPVDVLFIDTSHQFKHTLYELSKFGRLVREGGAIVIHDTNVRRLNETKWGLIRKALKRCQFIFLLKQLWGHLSEKDGVMKAIKVYLKQYPNDFLFTNYSGGDGLGVLTKIRKKYGSP